MHNSQPNTTLYCAEILLSWGGRIEHIVDSLMVILLYAYLAYLSPPSSQGFTILL